MTQYLQYFASVDALLECAVAASFDDGLAASLQIAHAASQHFGPFCCLKPPPSKFDSYIDVLATLEGGRKGGRKSPSCCGDWKFLR